MECHEACAHGGVHKNLAMVSHHFTWHGVARDVKQFVRGCHTCQTQKPQLLKSAGLLHTLPVPSAKFHTIGIDQITDLPPSKDGFDSILTVTCHLTKFVVLIPCLKYDDAESIATRLFDKVFSFFGIPVKIVSDRDPKYTSEFWKSLFKCLHTRLGLSTAYHPESDGQSERTNQTVESMLRCVCTQLGQDWAEKLPRVQFAVNTSIQESTQFTPAQLMFGYQPRNVLDVLVQSTQSMPENPSAAEMLESMSKDLQRAKDNLVAAKERQTEVANRSRRELNFVVGQEVLLSTTNMAFKVPRKLQPRFVGPFKVTRVVSPVAYELELPRTMARLHPVFHVSLLRPYVRGFGPPPAPPPPLDEGPGYVRLEVQAIIAHRKGRRGLEYRVLWKGYPLHESTWEPETHLDRCKALLNAYKRTHGLR